VVDGLIVGQKERVARQVLRVADHGEAGAHPRHHQRVLAAKRRADPVVTPVACHVRTVPNLA